MAKNTKRALMAARERLRVSIDRACLARGEAQWTNGYRAAKYSGRINDDPTLYEKEMRQWERVYDAEAAVVRAIRGYASVIRRAGEGE